MSKEKSISTLFKENKTLFIIIGVALFLIEIEIFAFALMKSGDHSKLQVIDANGDILYEADGENLSEFNKYYFESNFGPLKNYKVRRVPQERPFPFRVWLTAAVGVPIGSILLFAFVVKAFFSLFYGDKEKTTPSGPSEYKTGTKLEKAVSEISNLSVFTIGFFVVLALFLYMVIPDMIMYIGKTGEETIIKYKWFFLSLLMVILCLFTWIVYLKYRLAVKSIDAQTEIDKYRIQLEYHSEEPTPIELPSGASSTNPAIAWEGENDNPNDPDDTPSVSE